MSAKPEPSDFLSQGRHIGQIFFKESTRLAIAYAPRFTEADALKRSHGASLAPRSATPIRKIAVMQIDFPPEIRSVNAFQKIKVDHEAVAWHYQQEIEKIYSSVPEGEAN